MLLCVICVETTATETVVLNTYKHSVVVLEVLEDARRAKNICIAHPFQRSVVQSVHACHVGTFTT